MRNYLLILSLFVFYSLCGQNAGIYQTYVILDNGTTTYFHGGINNGGTTPYSNHSFGNVTQLAFKGGEIKSWKNNGGDVTGAKLYFRVYVSNPIPDPLPNFNELDLPWACRLIEVVNPNRDQHSKGFEVLLGSVPFINRKA